MKVIIYFTAAALIAEKPTHQLIVQFLPIGPQPCLFPMLLLAIIISHCAGEQSSLDYAKTRSRLLTLSLLRGAEDDRLPSHPLTEVDPEKQVNELCKVSFQCLVYLTKVSLVGFPKTEQVCQRDVASVEGEPKQSLSSLVYFIPKLK